MMLSLEKNYFLRRKPVVSSLVMILFGSFGLVRTPSASGQDAAVEAKVMSINDALPQFELRDFRGKTWASKEFRDKKAIAVVFFGVECPLVKLYSSRLIELADQNPSLQIIGINSNRHDSITEIENFAKLTKIEFPLLKDPANRVADQFGAQRTPEVFLFNSMGRLAYHGAIDDQYSYGLQREKPENQFFVEALASVLKGVEPRKTKTDAVGCIIGRVLTEQKASKVTYAKQISRLLNSHCVSCHRPGEIAPFSLTDFDEVVGWAEMIQEVVNDRRMPPWHANPAHGTFKNDMSLSQGQVELINTWVKNGAPFGDKADLPDPPKFVEGWRIGEPDAVVAMSKRPYRVPATGVIPYKHFVVDPGFKEDKWISAAECRIGNRAVVHHIIVAIHKEERLAAHGQIESEWITATAPGAQPLVLPEGYAKLIPAGAKLVFQMHYTPNGTAQSDLSSVGFKFVDPKTVKKSVGTREITNHDFRIPPGAENHKVTASRRFREDSLLLTLFPHMHLRGKSFRYTANYPDGTSEVLLDIPQFDFNWQNGYMFPEPKLIPKGTRIECVAHYDNSEKNFANPDPTKTIRWGDQTWDEMMIGYYDMALADQDLTKAVTSTRTEALLERVENGDQILSDEFRDFVRNALTAKQRSSTKSFGPRFREVFPQVDRVCFTTFEDETLRVVRCTQVSEFSRKIDGQGTTVEAKGTRLAEIHNAGKPQSIADLTKIGAVDMKYMSAVARSSFHVPAKINGKSGTVNFWSSEVNAFPKEVQQLLKQLVPEGK